MFNKKLNQSIEDQYIVKMSLYTDDEMEMHSTSNLGEAYDTVLDLHNRTKLSEATKFFIYRRSRLSDFRTMSEKVIELVGGTNGLVHVGVLQ